MASFTINELFPNAHLIKVDKKLSQWCHIKESPAISEARKKIIIQTINKMGMLSCSFQGLDHPVTSWEKLQEVDSHIIYLKKDVKANNGKGEIVGLLKIGYKHLFLYDEVEVLHEVDPPCLLDMLVLPNYQRQGHGCSLVQFMLEDMKIQRLHALAFELPSKDMKNFLQKNYQMHYLIPQPNHFSVAPEFFIGINSRRSNELSSRRPRRHAAAPLTMPSYERTAICKPVGNMANK